MYDREIMILKDHLLTRKNVSLLLYLMGGEKTSIELRQQGFTGVNNRLIMFNYIKKTDKKPQSYALTKYGERITSTLIDLLQVVKEGTA